MNIQQHHKPSSSPAVSSKSQQQLPLSAVQILQSNYELYLNERVGRQEAKGKPLTLEMFKHYNEKFTHLYASAHAFEEELRKRIEKDEQEEMLRAAAK
jgi:hypothetical protein